MSWVRHVHLRHDWRLRRLVGEPYSGTVCSLEGFSLGAESSVDHVSINGLNMGDFLNDHRPIILILRVSIDRIAFEQNGPEVGELRALGDFVPFLDFVVREVQRVQFLEGRHVVELLNDIVAKPQLLKSGRNIFQVINPSDVVARQRQNFEVLQALHGHDLGDCVGREAKDLTVLKLVDLIIKLLDLVRQHACEIDFCGLLWRDAALCLPSANCFSE